MIAALGPGIDFADLPIDLRARYAVDFRSRASMKTAVAALVSLAQPERRIRKDLLQRLRYPAQHDVDMSELRLNALRGTDQVIQAAGSPRDHIDRNSPGRVHLRCSITQSLGYDGLLMRQSGVWGDLVIKGTPRS